MLPQDVLLEVTLVEEDLVAILTASLIASIDVGHDFSGPHL
jgi:hypothetical protein